MALRRIARWILGVIVGVVLLVVTSALVAETPWFKERLRRIAVDRAAETLNGDLSIGRLSGSLWTGVRLENVALTQPSGPVLKVDRIDLQYDPRILLRGHLVFSSLRLLHPVVRIAQGTEGWNFATLVKPSGPNATPVAIQFHDLSIEDGQLVIEPAAIAPRRFGGVNANLALSSSADGLKVDVNRISMRDTGTGWTVNQGTASFASRARDLRGALDLATSAGTMRGTVSGDQSNGVGAFDATMKLASVDLAPILANANVPTDITGSLQAQVRLPATASGSAAISFQVDAASVSAMGYDARGVKGRGSYGEGVLHLEMAGAAYGAEATARGEWRSESAPMRPIPSCSREVSGRSTSGACRPRSRRRRSRASSRAATSSPTSRRVGKCPWSRSVHARGRQDCRRH